MTKSGFDSRKYKSDQRRDWDAVADGWMKWRDVLERGAGGVTQHLLDAAGLRPGSRVLDIACGTGETALASAARVAPGGHVTAVDQSSGMLAAARVRARERGADNLDFETTDAEVLAGIAPGFDAVVSRWGLMFLPDLDAALCRIARLLQPWGRLAIAVWSTPEEVPSISLPLGVLGELLELTPPPAGTPNPFRLADTDALGSRMEAAGFEAIRVESVPVVFELPAAQAYTDMTRDIAAPVIAVIEGQPAAQQPALWNAVTRAAEAYSVPEGGVRFENRALCITAVRAQSRSR